MKKLLIGFVLTTSLSAAACEWTIQKTAHVETWFALFRTNIISTAGYESGSETLKALETLTKTERLAYANSFHNLYTRFGHVGSFNKTAQAIEDAVINRKTVCELAEELSINYKYVEPTIKH